MPPKEPISLLNQDDCVRIIVEYLSLGTPQVASYGYDLYLPKIMRSWISESAAELGIERDWPDRYLPEVSVQFYSAAWELCRRGILRPGIRQHGLQSTEDGSAGNGYSLTPFGKQWLSEKDKDALVPTEPGRFSEMISPFGKIYGPGFQERADEAIRCYSAGAYLACCILCGAAAESVLLSLAVRKTQDEAEVLKKYKAANGRKTLENMIIGEQRSAIKSDFEVCFSLLKYWRDEGAHGKQFRVGENEAYTSLALLLRCAQFAKNNYQTLTNFRPGN